MLSVPPVAANWRIHHLWDLSWEVSRAAESVVEAGHPAGDEHLVAFWTGTRGLANQWLRALTEWESAARTAADCERFEALGTEIFAGDLLIRLWATLLSVLDRQSETNNARPVLDLAVFNLQHVRHRLLAAMLMDASEFAELDRTRRRSERWTDVLLGPLVVRYGRAQYAHEPRRAWDFGEDAAVAASDIGDRMLRASYRTAFLDVASRQPLAGEHWPTIITAIDAQAAVALGPLWPSRWTSSWEREPDNMPAESAFVRSLRRLERQRRVDQ